MMRFWNDIPPLWRCECVVHKRERPLIAWNKVIFMHTFYFSQYSSASYLYGIRSFTRTFSAFWRSQVFLSASKAANTYLNATYEHFTLYDFYLTSKIPCRSVDMESFDVSHFAKIRFIVISCEIKTKCSVVRIKIDVCLKFDIIMFVLMGIGVSAMFQL